MLQELLLALSGYSSPLLHDNCGKVLELNTNDFLSPAETALLTSLSRDLGQKHSSIRRRADDIVTNHPSAISRAVCASILSKHLAEFQQKILDVERSILDEDSSIVGAYNIVPLSAITAAFDGWDRKLEWLWELVSNIRIQASRDEAEVSEAQSLSTASSILRYLRGATHTGYSDIAQISLELVKVAETAWLKQLTSWLLYGKLPSIGAADFFVAQNTKEENQEPYEVHLDRIPPFVDAATANSIFFVGKSLSHINSRGTVEAGGNSSLTGSTVSSLRSSHLHELASLTSPINASRFTGAIRSIRLSLSKNVLQHILPLPKVIETLQILKNYFLLGRGEFAVALISAADERLAEKQSSSMDRYRHKGYHSLSHLVIKEGVASAILDRAWIALASFRSLDDEDDSVDTEVARKSIELSLESKVRRQRNSATAQELLHVPDIFQDLLVPTSTVLTMRIQSPLDLFLTSVDVARYSRIHAYLLAIQRAHLHLGKLFTLFGMRRDPKPLASRTASERSQLPSRQQRRASERAKNMRSLWATVGSAVFFLATIGEYLHSEVIQGSWDEFHRWLDPTAARPSRPSSREDNGLVKGLGVATSSERSQASDATPLLGATSLAGGTFWDPERLMMAHQSFVDSLCRSLLLNETSFTERLRAFMTDIDHLCALMNRLNAVVQSVDLQMALNNSTTSTNSESEERRLFEDLGSARRKVDAGLTVLVALLQNIDATRSNATTERRFHSLEADDEFVPRMSNILDRLLLKLDYANPPSTVLPFSDTDAFG